jgi:hypothetical protein
MSHAVVSGTPFERMSDEVVDDNGFTLNDGESGGGEDGSETESDEEYSVGSSGLGLSARAPGSGSGLGLGGESVPGETLVGGSSNGSSSVTALSQVDAADVSLVLRIRLVMGVCSTVADVLLTTATTNTTTATLGGAISDGDGDGGGGGDEGSGVGSSGAEEYLRAILELQRVSVACKRIFAKAPKAGTPTHLMDTSASGSSSTRDANANNAMKATMSVLGFTALDAR